MEWLMRGRVLSLRQLRAPSPEHSPGRPHAHTSPQVSLSLHMHTHIHIHRCLLNAYSIIGLLNADSMPYSSSSSSSGARAPGRGSAPREHPCGRVERRAHAATYGSSDTVPSSGQCRASGRPLGPSGKPVTGTYPAFCDIGPKTLPP